MDCRSYHVEGKGIQGSPHYIHGLWEVGLPIFVKTGFSPQSNGYLLHI
jgi:hypothetical protein